MILADIIIVKNFVFPLFTTFTILSVRMCGLMIPIRQTKLLSDLDRHLDIEDSRVKSQSNTLQDSVVNVMYSVCFDQLKSS